MSSTIIDDRLISLAKKFCCDKYFSHSYIDFYSYLLSKLKIKRLLEIGIGYEDLMKPFVPKYIHGASLLMWREYLPEAQIMACDIREDTLIQDKRITSVQCDQSSVLSLLDMIGRLGGEFDIVIDDGSHIQQHQILAAKTLLPYLSRDGVYVIEDVFDHEIEDTARRLNGVPVRFNMRSDDNLVVIRKDKT